jgi:glutamate synthase (NADPH/NADH) large chain
MYSYCNSVMEPWDGPAAIAATDGRWVIAGMDRNGLRPCRYVISNGLLIVGSETGMVKVDESTVVEKGRVGPGQMIGVDLAEGRFYRANELPQKLAASKPFSSWVKNITVIDSLVKSHGESEPAAEFSREDLRRRMVAVGWTMEDIELLLHPTSIEACTTSSGRTSARSPTRRSTPCASGG